MGASRDDGTSKSVQATFLHHIMTSFFFFFRAAVMFGHKEIPLASETAFLNGATNCRRPSECPAKLYPRAVSKGQADVGRFSVDDTRCYGDGADIISDAPLDLYA